MIPFKFPALILVATSLFLTSCNTDEKKVSEETMNTDSTTVTTPETPAEPGNHLIVKHKVANFEKFKTVYDSHDSARLANGLRTFLIARGLKDSNMVMIVLNMDDTIKAKQFAASAYLKNAMKKAGATGTPSFQYLDVKMLDASLSAGTTRVIVTHKVKDWEAWKRSFDSHKQVRVDAGLADRAISYSLSDNRMVTVAFIINDMRKAEAFMASQDLKDKMAEAGVVGPPDFFFYNVVQTY